MTGHALKKILRNTLLTSILLLLISGVLIYAATRMPGISFSGELPPLTTEQAQIRDALGKHVYSLAGEIGERSGSQMSKLNETADYIEAQFSSYGYIPVNRTFAEEQYRNIEIDLYGLQKRDEIIVVGAHYDTTWMTPGADDNASGVAALLEISRILDNRRYARTIRLVAFANEEVPYYRRAEMGSMVSAKRSYNRSEQIVAMFSLEMLGYYSEQPGSQRYPQILRPFYPDRGNFIAFIANPYSINLQYQAISYFRDQQIFPSEGLIAPPWLVRVIRRSDHASYWYYDYPAVMITDTSFYRNPHYHRGGDSWQTLDYDRMARVVDGLVSMLEKLAEE